MGNIFDLKEGMLFSIKLNENARGHWGNSVMYSDWKAGVMHKYAVAFFNYLYASKQALKENMETRFKVNPS